MTTIIPEDSPQAREALGGVLAGMLKAHMELGLRFTVTDPEFEVYEHRLLSGMTECYELLNHRSETMDPAETGEWIRAGQPFSVTFANKVFQYRRPAARELPYAITDADGREITWWLLKEVAAGAVTAA